MFNNIQAFQLPVETLIKEIFYVTKYLSTCDMPFLNKAMNNRKERKELVKMNN